MKKILSLFVLAIGCITLASCSDDDYTEKENSVKVVQANTIIAYTGGSTAIEVTGSGISAVSAAEWLTVSVSGNIITATATQNTSRESRATHITAKASNGDYTLIPIQQEGWTFDTSIFSLAVNDAAEEYAFTVSSAYPITVTSNSNWFDINYDAETGNVTVNMTANNTGLPRSGSINVESAGTVKTIPVYQAEFETDVLGKYKFGFTAAGKDQSNYTYIDAVLTSKSLTINVSDTQSFKIPISFPNGGEAPYIINVADEIAVGESDGYYCFLGFDNYQYNFLGRYASYFFNYLSASAIQGVLNVETDGDGNSTGLSCLFAGDIDLDGSNYGAISSWYILAMKDEVYSQSNYVGTLNTFYWPVIVKVTE